MNLFTPGARIHVIGVGGAGMSAVAMLLSEYGAVVTGSDDHEAPVFDELRARRVSVYVGRDVARVRGAQFVLWSPAVALDHVELRGAIDQGAIALSRAEVLEALAATTAIVGLCGTHGKTTATSMMVQIALAAGRDDAWLVGAPVLGVGANGHWGAGRALVEVDESFGTFARVRPYALGLLNVEADHLDFYASVADLEGAFLDLVNRTSGPVVVWGDDVGAARVAAAASKTVVRVGVAAGEWRVEETHLERRQSSFTLRGPDRRLDVTLRVTGAHNVANAAVVATLASALDIDDDAIVRGLANFVGAPRRDQFRGRWRGLDVYESYAHLPGEIAATLRAAHDVGYVAPLVVFQPHRVTRTVALADAFAPAFDGAARVVVTDLYDAGEANPAGVTGGVIVQALRAHDGAPPTQYCAELRDVVEAIEPFVTAVDSLWFLGAGDVASVIETLPGGLS